jgi:valyl-tRNA synthetase
MLGDTALIVNPNDERYQHLHGKTVHLPLTDRHIPIIADPMADPKFGTGVVKITPAHDPNDFEAGKRHNLPSVKVIGEDARMTAAAGRYAGLDRFEARRRIIAALEQTGELQKTEPYLVNVSKCDRSKTIIEPLVSNQWFVSMKPLAAKAMEAVRSGRIRFVPDDREVVFFQWMENIRDWCISRQLWWGHRIPAWHCKNCGKITVAREVPATCPHCHSTEVEQDSDVLDTWFSSGLWPFSTLGWPDDTEDLRTFYPTSLLITGFDILFFWVSRMIMLGIECTGDVPFREVHMHGLVRDAERQKMSKTKGNVINPLDMIDRFGTDALRVALLISAATGADIALKEDRVASSQAFANKIWNASRLLFMNMERSGVADWTPQYADLVNPSNALEDIWIFERFEYARQTVSRALENHRYHEAAETLWNFIWKEFCDWYLEIKKQRFREASGIDEHWRAALTIYEASLRLLHPFMPFLTEELWQRLIHGSDANQKKPRSISLAPFPQEMRGERQSDSLHQFNLLQQVITAARELRADHKLDPKTIYPATLCTTDHSFTADSRAIAATLVKLNFEGSSDSNTPQAGIARSAPDFDLHIHAVVSQNGALSPENKQRILKEIAKLEGNINNSNRQLGDATFLQRAPAKVVEGIRAKLAEYEIQLKKLRDSLGEQ